MAPDEFDALVTADILEAERDPSRFRRKVIGLALLGHTYFAFLAMAGAVGVGGAAYIVFTRPDHRWIGVAVFLACGVFLLSLPRALAARFARPTGVRLSRRDAPHLFEELERLRTIAGAPAIHRVWLTADFNAGFSEVPLLGFLGWRRRHLVLGLPLLQLLAVDELRSIVAHELGHASHAYGRLRAWVYRVRERWRHLEVRLEHVGRFNVFLSPFLRWFVPRFDAATFVFCRAQEYAADRISARSTDASIVARALVRVSVLSRYLDERFWPDVWRERTQATPDPSPGIFAELERAVHALDEHDGARWLAEALAVPTNNRDTHPCLSERLRAIGVADTSAICVPPPAIEPAARALLATNHAALVERVDTSWREAVRPGWQRDHRQWMRSRERESQTVSGDAEGTPSSGVEWWRIADLLETGQRELARPRLIRFADRHPELAMAQLALGDLLLGDGNNRGVEHLERAMARDRWLIPWACDLLRDHLQRTGRAQEATEYERLAHRHEGVLGDAVRERSDFTHRTPLLPHGLDPPRLADLHGLLQGHHDVRAVDVARVDLKHLPEHPIFLVAITLDVRWYQHKSAEIEGRLQRRLAEVLPLDGDVVPFVVRSESRRLARHVAQQSGAGVYAKDTV